MSLFDDLAGQLSEAVDDVFASDFAYTPMAGGVVDTARRKLTCIRGILKETRDIENGKTRSGGGREVKFAGRINAGQCIIDIDRCYLLDGEPKQFDVFRHENGQIYTVDYGQPDGVRLSVICWKGFRKK